MRKLSFVCLIVFVGAFWLPAQVIDVTYPTRGLSFCIGDTCTIAWTSTGAVGTEIFVSALNEDTGVWYDIGWTENDLSYPWRITDAIPAGQYTITLRNRDRSAIDRSDPFTIANCASRTPTLTVSSPNGGESWPLGGSRSITWAFSNVTGTVNISLMHGDTVLGPIGSANVADGAFPWTVGNYTGGRGTVRAGYRIRITHSSGTPSDDSNERFSISATDGGTDTPPGSGHDLIISDPYLEFRSGSKGFRVKITDLTSDFEGWVNISTYCMDMGLGNSEVDRRRLELRRGVPAWVNLRNTRSSYFRGDCDETFVFKVNPDHAVTESNYDNNFVQSRFFWNHHDGRFFSLRLGSNYTQACNECQVRVNRQDVEVLDSNRIRLRLEITVQNCGSEAISNGSLRVYYNYRYSVGEGRMQDGGGLIDTINDIDVPPGHWRIFNRTVTIERHLNNSLAFEFHSGADDVPDNNNFHSHLTWAGF